MDINEKIEGLRKVFSSADEDSVLGDEFAKFIKHPQLTWNDLIGLLRFKVVIGEYASFKLHDFLDVHITEEGPIQDQKEWYKILKDKKIEPSELVQEIKL
jgi:hypothetical protein